MTCLKGEVLDGPGMKSHTFLLRTFFVYTLGLRMPIFKINSSLKRMGKMFSLFNVTAMKSLELFPRRFREYFFLKINIQRAKVYTKNVPNNGLHSCSVQYSVYQASHCSALLTMLPVSCFYPVKPNCITELKCIYVFTTIYIITLV